MTHPALLAGAAALWSMKRHRFMSQQDVERVSRTANVAFLRWLHDNVHGPIDADEYLRQVAKSIAEDR